jgi:pyruvate-ferredoxin/flavodoxin oxidoreductase
LIEKAPSIPRDLAVNLLHNEQNDEADIVEQREWVAALQIQASDNLAGGPSLKSLRTAAWFNLKSLADYLVKKSVWIVAVTAGPTTSATAASITCWPAVATSTSW